MSAQAQVTKLESLLARVQRNRHEVDRSAVPLSADLIEEAHSDLESALASAEPRPSRPTPMEHALEAELAVEDADALEAAALEAAIESEETVVEIVMDDDDEPELILDVDESPTAPISTPSPVGTSAPTPARTQSPVVSAPSAPTAPRRSSAVSTEATTAKGPRAAAGPQSIELPTASASSPIARTVSRAEPETFGQLLGRTLALRPR